ncbi:glycosyltransferase family 4 protein [Prochlorococcus marinus]|uniref:glycosyltransferase family 4 protein n=1 Tax=Prochlorococcus marinus TaxID=1219 RepID=UPI0022B47184|nr:MraY family glycosyltransferase [Prochlorococcus marinus]
MHSREILALVTMLITAVITAVISIPVRSIGLKLGFVDQPNKRKQHQFKLVRIGGLAMIAAYLTLAIFIIFTNNFTLVNSNQSILIASLIGSVGFFLIGFADDIFSISPWSRLTFQTVIATYAWSNGIKFQILDVPFFNKFFSSFFTSDILSLFITVFWLVAVTNAINWIDGMDGLASGISGMVLIGLGSIAISNNNLGVALLAFATTGSCLGFLVHNSYPARILMGDGGSYFLGFNLASLSLLVSIDSSNLIILRDLNFLLPLVFLALPMADMTIVILLRLLRGTSPFYPDRNHFHHRLLDSGYKYYHTLLILFTITFVIILLSSFLSSLLSLFTLLLLIGLYVYILAFPLLKVRLNIF